ncbi:FAD-dependent oxidoreductase [Clostridium sp. YIM B02515]|uniref:FAD-dependent oxidoreductase n=1 Tax=Clostridium rhizosphaerae TaxID=2803861 RepID=A0ABS1T5U5_9CLOT|nr:FAD-dependent oxidoreductase [Clostridium rhizosphaerae]MBL4934497.1 FAD-dependent oxidoreductase [Clostridium rhizosphaerae]
MDKKNKIKDYEVIVIGGGMAGVCAAIASAREGAKTALVNNRPVLGGNASSEIRMHICGADYHGFRQNARETGIIEEILLDNKRVNRSNSFSILDTILWEKTRFQENLDLYLNTHITSLIKEEDKIVSVIGEQLTTEKVFQLNGQVFIDATGDGTIAYLSGAEYMSGREGKKVFGEKYAPDEPDNHTMGNTLLFTAIDMGKKVDFVKPEWANTYKEEDLAYREHHEINSGYWWIEIGGDNLEVIQDGEQIRDELLKAVYGVWDHIKNSGHHNADNFALDWVGFLPGKRESRRIVGDYILREQDLFAGRIFEDAIAYGGWPMDMHTVGGIRTRREPNDFIMMEDLYTIPYRSIYSKNIGNLMLAGRDISASHMAFGSTRVMATCAVIGQAAGTAAAMCTEKKILPRGLNEHISELQQKLMKDDCFIPGFKNEDKDDQALSAKVSASSFLENCEPENIINGCPRTVKDQINAWIAKSSDKAPWIELAFQNRVSPKEIRIKFDSNLSKEIMVSMTHSVRERQQEGTPKEIVKDYDIEFYDKEILVGKREIRDNHRRLSCTMVDNISCDKIRVKPLSTWGAEQISIYEIRVY